MTLLDLSGIALVLLAVAYSIRKAKADIRKEEAEAKAEFVKDPQEFLSIWALAHQWIGLEPCTKLPSEVPLEVKRQIDKIILAYFRKELSIRNRIGYRIRGHHWLEKVLSLDTDFEKLWACLTKELDIAFIDGVYVMRSEVLRWCDKEFHSPPLCWAPPSVIAKPNSAQAEDDEQRHWYKDLTTPRKEKVACLEVAKHLWEQDSALLYEEVRTHPVMTRAGLRNVFTAETFKTWAREIAPEEAKKGGRRPQSVT